MRHARYAAALAPLLLAAACGDCGDGEGVGEEVAAAGRAEATAAEPNAPPARRLPSRHGGPTEGCLAFCRKSLECADAEGRPVPPEARDCEASCSPGGTHHAAPETVWECAKVPCGTAFTHCSMQALMEHMRQSDVAVFPISCEGLCEKAAWCAHRLGQPPGPGEDDCRAACEAGGAYADVSPREYRCAEAACGQPFEACRVAGGPANEPPQP